MKTILITGASGLIGQYVIPYLLSQNYKVYVIGRTVISIEGVTFYPCDLFNTEEVKKIVALIQPQYLLHLAWDIQDLTSNNHFTWIQASLNLLQNFHLYGGKRVVFLGTCFEYEDSTSVLSEDSNIFPNSTYAWCKHYLHNIAKLYSEQNSIDFVWARVFYTYGNNEKEPRLFPYLINSLLNNQPVVIKTPSSIKDYLYAGDIAYALVKLIESPFNGVMNLCSGIPITVGEFALNVAKYLDKEDLITLNQPNDQPFSQIVGDNTVMKKELSFTQFTPISKVLQNILE